MKRIKISWIGKVAANFVMDTDSTVIKEAWTHMMKNVSKNMRHLVKKEYFDKEQASEGSIKSPVTYISGVQWQKLVKMWSSPKHRLCCVVVGVFSTSLAF